MKKLISIALALALTFSVYAKDVSIGAIERGITANNVCSVLEDGDKVRILSPGGAVDEALLISNCIRNKEVIVEVETALSAATYLVLAGKKVCFNMLVQMGFHSPYTTDRGGLIVVYGINELRDFANEISHDLFRWNYTSLERYSILGIMLIAPFNDMRYLYYHQLVTLLGDRYIGGCKA